MLGRDEIERLLASCTPRDQPARRVAPKAAASVRDIPLVAQLARLLAAHKLASRFAAGTDWAFATSHGTPYGDRTTSLLAMPVA